MPKLLIGTKKDMEATARQVEYQEGKELADHFGVNFIETSSLSNTNVQEAFMLLSREIKSRVQTDQKLDKYGAA